MWTKKWVNNGQTWLVKLSPTSLQFHFSLLFCQEKSYANFSFMNVSNSICVKGKRQKTFYEVISIWEKRNTSFIPILMGNGKKGSKKLRERFTFYVKPSSRLTLFCFRLGSSWAVDVVFFCFVIEWNILLLFRLVNVRGQSCFRWQLIEPKMSLRNSLG